MIVKKFIIFVTAEMFLCLVNTHFFYKDVITICINCVCPYNSIYCYGKLHIKNKPGHLVNLGELVGLETYNLLCMAVPTSYLEICHCSVTINFVIDKKFKTERNTTIIVLGELKRFYSSF